MSSSIVFLHGLGLSARAFDPVRALLPDRAVLGIDLPGHGESPLRDGLPAAATAELVIAAIAAAGLDEYVLVGHSMGGKIASLVARRTLDAAVAAPPARVVLLAPSPPTPEPIDDARRARMLSWVADDEALSTASARAFVEQNVAASLDPRLDAMVVADLRRTVPHAWRRWLTTGSREDVSREVGAVDLPAVVLGGVEDEDLGAGAQPRLHGGVYPRAEFVEVAQAGHLLTYEAPGAVAAAIAAR